MEKEMCHCIDDGFISHRAFHFVCRYAIQIITKATLIFSPLFVNRPIAGSV